MLSTFEIFKAFGSGVLIGFVGIVVIFVPIILMMKIKRLEESTIKALTLLQEDQNHLTKKLIILYNLLEVMNTLSTYDRSTTTIDTKPTKTAPVLKIMKPIELDLDLPPVDNKNEF